MRTEIVGGADDPYPPALEPSEPPGERSTLEGLDDGVFAPDQHLGPMEVNDVVVEHQHPLQGDEGELHTLRAPEDDLIDVPRRSIRRAHRFQDPYHAAISVHADLSGIAIVGVRKPRCPRAPAA